MLLHVDSLDNIGRITWTSEVKNLLFLYGFGYVWIAHEVGDTEHFLHIFKQRLIDCHTQNWHQTVSESSRCHYYKHYKTLLNTERYLSINLPLKLRKALSRYRCSSHKLYIGNW